MTSHDPKKPFDHLPEFAISDDERLPDREYTHQNEKPKNSKTLGQRRHFKGARFNLSWATFFSFFLLVVIIIQSVIFYRHMDQSESIIQQLTAHVDQIHQKVLQGDEQTVKSKDTFAQEIDKLSQQYHLLKKESDRIQRNTDHQVSLLKKSQKTVNSEMKKIHNSLKEKEKSVQLLKNQWDNEAQNFAEKEKVWDQKIAEYKTFMQSIDSYRLQINKKILQIENSLRDVQK